MSLDGEQQLGTDDQGQNSLESPGSTSPDKHSSGLSLSSWLWSGFALLLILCMLWWQQPDELPQVEPMRWGDLQPRQVSSINEWDFLIIHHSGANVGDAAGIDRDHQDRGWEGIGYHFVIGNDRPMPMGKVEWTFRWDLQRHGAHVKVGNINKIGIGICLIGNFEEQRVPLLQWQRAVELCALLVAHIPSLQLENILGHGEVTGTSTQCPGHYFDMHAFRADVERRLHYMEASNSVSVK